MNGYILLSFRMFCVYKNIYYFIINKNFFLKNFFLINYFNSYTLLISKFNKEEYAYFSSKKMNLNYKLNFSYLEKNLFLLRFFKYFNKVVFLKGNSIKINQLNLNKN